MSFFLHNSLKKGVFDLTPSILQDTIFNSEFVFVDADLLPVGCVSD